MSAYILHDEFRCSYPFKFCPNQRAHKKNGDLHKLCQEHRERANLHRKNLTMRRRQIKEQLRQSGDDAGGQVSTDHRLTFTDIAYLLDDAVFLHVVCTEDDLKAVDELLSGTDSDE